MEPDLVGGHVSATRGGAAMVSREIVRSNGRYEGQRSPGCRSAIDVVVSP